MKRTTTALAWTLAVTMFAVSPLVAAPKDPAAVRGPAARAVLAVQAAAESEAVKLDDEQKTKVHGVIEDAMAQAKAIQEENRSAQGDGKEKGDRQAIRAKVAELQQNTVGKVEAVLTEEQKPAFREALRVEREKMRDERGNKGGKQPGDKPAK